MIEITKERIELLQQLLFHLMCFLIMHFVSKFQLFIHIFKIKSKAVKLKNKNQKVFVDSNETLCPLQLISE